MPSPESKLFAFLFLCVIMYGAWVSLMYILLRIRIRGWKRRERELMALQAKALMEIAMLRSSAADVDALRADVKKTVRRHEAIRAKAEARLVAQNTELEALRTIILHLPPS